MNNERQDVYTRITDKIIADLEQGVRTWMKPWNAGNTAGRITRPLRHNGLPYSGINILMLWAEAMDKGFAAPIWMTFKQASELKAHVRKGEKGSLVVYANSTTRTEPDDNGEACAPASSTTSPRDFSLTGFLRASSIAVFTAFRMSTSPGMDQSLPAIL
jgi:antirestriction protein ArdC